VCATNAAERWGRARGSHCAGADRRCDGKTAHLYRRAGNSSSNRPATDERGKSGIPCARQQQEHESGRKERVGCRRRQGSVNRRRHESGAQTVHSPRIWAAGMAVDIFRERTREKRGATRRIQEVGGGNDRISCWYGCPKLAPPFANLHQSVSVFNQLVQSPCRIVHAQDAQWVTP